MGHYKKVNGKMQYSPTSFVQEASTAVNSIKPGDLKPGTKVAMSGKSHTYLGSTDHEDEVHHFQDSKGGYKSYATNDVPAMQSRDAMENGKD